MAAVSGAFPERKGTALSTTKADGKPGVPAQVDDRRHQHGTEAPGTPRLPPRGRCPDRGDRGRLHGNRGHEVQQVGRAGGGQRSLGELHVIAFSKVTGCGPKSRHCRWVACSARAAARFGRATQHPQVGPSGIHGPERARRDRRNGYQRPSRPGVRSFVVPRASPGCVGGSPDRRAAGARSASRRGARPTPRAPRRGPRPRRRAMPGHG